MKSTKKYFELVESFKKQLEEARPEAINELETRIDALQQELDPMKMRKDWNDFLMAYKPTDADLEQARIVFPQINALIDPVVQSYKGTNVNFLFSWFIERRQQNFLTEQAHKIANALMCAALGKVETGLFVLEPNSLYEKHGYQFGFEYLLKLLMPEETAKKLEQIEQKKSELNDLKARLDEIKATETAA